MRIENKTPWKTEHLRAIARRVLDDVVDTSVRKEAFIRFTTGRDPTVTGSAYFQQVYVRHEGPFWFMIVRPPSPYGLRARIIAKIGQDPVGPQTRPVVVDKVQLAATIAHETGHWGGRRNRSLRGSHIHDARTPEAQARFAWAADMPLEPAEQKVVPVAAREARRVRDYQAKVREWETKSKRSQTALAKWRRRLTLAEARQQKAARP